jgi:hypothetical protein
MADTKKNATLTNAYLIAMIEQFGEEAVAEKLVQKMKHDAQQKSYHAKYNRARNATFKNMREIAAEQGLTVDQLIAKVNAAANK